MTTRMELQRVALKTRHNDAASLRELLFKCLDTMKVYEDTESISSAFKTQAAKKCVELQAQIDRQKVTITGLEMALKG